ncbi:MAG: hypothetical protein RID53_11680 [Coleofasciculus sp. B1-GNL1-01]|uniref:hypothetical protein n=1 Tax=Coleofasciculus sp. B1-GNL1-01 TaxID=3068484 RepID=UPI0032FDCFCD
MSIQREWITNSRIPWFLGRVLYGVSLGLIIACQAEPPSGVNSPGTSAESVTSSSSTEPATQTNSSSTDSQTTYKNESLGIRFEYPEGFVVDDTNKQSDAESEMRRGTVEVWTQADYEAMQTNEFEGTELPANVSLWVYRNPDRLSLQDWVESRSEYFVSPQNYTQQQVANQDAIAFQSTGLYEFETIVLPSRDGQDIIVLRLAKGSGNEAVYQQAFERIQGTLQLLR